MIAAPPIYAVSAETIELLSLEKVHPHPHNPPERMEAAALADLLPLIEEFGQHDPATVRPHPDIIGAYQLTSGHRRYACLRLLGRDAIRANVIEQTDTEALQSVVIANAGRKDLDPIQRAELLEHLVRPIDDGGAGMDRESAGRMFGLESASGVKNTLRLLALPPSIRSMVADGTLPARVARSLVPYAAAVVMLDAIAKDLRSDKYLLRRTLDDGKIEGHELRRRWRPVDGKTKYFAGYAYAWGDQPRRFEMDDATKVKLQVVDLPFGPKGKLIPVAQNVDLFDKLNKPAILAYLAAREKQGKAKPKTGAAAPTAAELAAKEKEQRERLKNRTAEWRIQFLRLLLTTQTPIAEGPMMAAAPAIFAAASQDLSIFLGDAISSLRPDKSSQGGYMHGAESVDAAIAVGDPHGCKAASGAVLVDRLWRLLVWPGGHEGLSSVSEGLPVRFPWLSSDMIERLATVTGVSIEDGWKDAATDSSPEREMMALWLTYHTKDQLRTLSAELDHVPQCDPTKSALIASLLTAHRVGTPLPLPKLLRPKAAKKTTKKRGAK